MTQGRDLGGVPPLANAYRHKGATMCLQAQENGKASNPYTRQAILELVLTVLHEQSGWFVPDGADKLISAHHRVSGWDLVEVLERLECEYWVDLQDFVDSRLKRRLRWVRLRPRRRGLTARDLACHIHSLVRDRPIS